MKKVLILLIFITSFLFYNNLNLNKDYIYVKKNDLEHQLSSIDMSKAKKLMIVAHPDDESIFGGHHLLNDSSYLVVCVTCGTNITRNFEFNTLMDKYNVQYLSLGFPDINSNNEVDDWEDVKTDIYKSLDYIINYKNWDLIVTHNPNGEYGHIHHKKVSSMTSFISVFNEKQDNLFYFGYDKRKNRINERDLFLKKHYIFTYYPSQLCSTKYFEYLYPYENWVNFNDWSF